MIHIKLPRRTRRAAILGCGPAGLFAAHALIGNGWEVTIFSKKRKSHMFGAQYLHSPIPGLTESDGVEVAYRLVGGTADEYRAKVYGPNPVTTSVETLGKTHQAWDIREAYDNAWDRYSHLVRETNVTPEWLGAGSGEEAGTFLAASYWDIVISSIPMPNLCYRKDDHQFHATSIWAIGDAPARGQYAPYRAPANTIECNASRDVGWYRASNVFGHVTVEWPGRSKPPLPAVAEVSKPISTDCICYRGREMGFKFMPIGRYGQWSKGILSHHAYTQAVQL